MLVARASCPEVDRFETGLASSSRNRQTKVHIDPCAAATSDAVTD